MISKNRIFLILAIFLLIFKLGFSQVVSLETPYDAINTHLYFLQGDSYEPQKSANVIYGKYSQSEKEDYAIKIKKVLDGKGLYINMDALPKNPNYIDSLSKKSIYFLSSKENLIYLEKVNNSWYYSTTTINNIDVLYKDIYPFWAVYLDGLLSNKLSESSFLGIKSWQYLASLILVILSFVLYKLFRFFSFLFIKRIALPIFKTKLPNKDLLIKIAKSLSLVITSFFVGKMIPSIHLPLKFSVFVIQANRILLIFFIAFLVYNVFKLLLFYLEKVVEKTETKLDNQILPILEKISRIIIFFTAIIYALQELDINVTAILAGLSIGGLAVALASKDTVQNIIGSLNIFLDRPFEIGDYIVVSEAEGTVVEVGLRATRIRTPNQTLAYIPNGNLSNMTIDNFGLRVYRRWKTTLGLDYNTSPEKIELFIEEVKAILVNNDFTLNDKTMVYFNNLGSSTLDIYMSVFFDVESFREDLNSKQDILLAILKMTHKHEIEFAFPTQTIYRK